MADYRILFTMQGTLSESLSKESVTCASIDTNYLVVGTETGKIILLSFSGQFIRQYRAHDQPINDVSIENNNGSISILSCSDNGCVLLISVGPDDESSKEYSIQFSEPLKRICLEGATGLAVGSGTVTSRKERSFIVGGASGRLILHRTGWFQQTNSNLYVGSGSEVSSLAWKGNIVAWSDASVVRLMDISTQTGICHISAPVGVSVDDPFPCRLFWETDRDLLIGWADSFKHIGIETTTDPSLLAEGSAKVARTIEEWQTDCIICGLFPFDANHLILLGYSPPDEDSFNHQQRLAENHGKGNVDLTNLPEVLIVKRTTGQLVSADCLPIRGPVNMVGPECYWLLSSYQCQHNATQDAMNWDLSIYTKTRGGERGFAPINFIISPRDFIAARVRDVNDRIALAIQSQDLKQAVDLAKADRNSLTKYQFVDLLNLYLTDLLERQVMNPVPANPPPPPFSTYASYAASECHRLVDSDATLWELWISKFIRYQQIEAVCPYIPTSQPRLPSHIYEEVLRHVFVDRPTVLLDLVKKWGKVKPHLFNHEALLARLEVPIRQQQQNLVRYQQSLLSQQQKGSHPTPSASFSIPTTTGSGPQDVGQVPVQQPQYLEAKAQIHIFAGEYEKTLNSYLDIQVHTSVYNSIGTSVDSEDPLESGSDPSDKSAYRYVFELIEKQNLFKVIESKVINIIRLSKTLSAKLLVENVDKLPIKSIVNQLSGDRRLLYWYLHNLFLGALDVYSNKTEYGDLHKMSIDLYAEFAPRPVRTSPKRPSSERDLVKGVDGESPPSRIETLSPRSEADHWVETPFLRFLKSGLAPWDTALEACERHDPPLYSEIIFILSQMGRHRRALQLLLSQIGSVPLAVEFIENQIFNFSNQGGLLGRSSSPGASGEDFLSGPTAIHPSLLWDDLIEHALDPDHRDCLIQLVDYLGLCKLGPASLIRLVPNSMKIPKLKVKLVRMLQRLQFQMFANEKCNSMLEGDALSLLRQQNQDQRKAIKVDVQTRCAACSRLLSNSPGHNSHQTVSSPTLDDPLLGDVDHYLSTIERIVQIWGPCATLTLSTMNDGSSGSPDGMEQSTGLKPPTMTGSIIFSSRLAFHALCYERIRRLLLHRSNQMK